jgi:hypothetical protein
VMLTGRPRCPCAVKCVEVNEQIDDCSQDNTRSGINEMYLKLSY